MTFEQSLVAELGTILEITAFVGTRIYESALPQKSSLPAIVYHVTNEDHAVHLTGRSTTRAENIVLDLIALDKVTCRQMLDPIHRHFFKNTFQGVLGGGVYVAETILGEVDYDVFRLSDGTDRPVRVASVTFSMRYSRAS